MPINGLVVMTPTSIAVTGAGSESATINADGSVEYSNAYVLSLNGIFTSDYDNYMISFRHYPPNPDGSLAILARLRASGTDASTNYTYQFLNADSTTVAGNRYSVTYGLIGYAFGQKYGGDVCYIFGPYLSQPTAARSVNASGRSDAFISDNVWTHSTSASYDGLSVGRFDNYLTSGLLTVFGFNQ